MKCHHIPSEPIAAFCFVCKHCGVDIESIPCKACDGDGTIGSSHCDACNGTGVDHWEAMK
jgi:DnaJ-class molecular chaperone